MKLDFQWVRNFLSSPDRPADMQERASSNTLTEADLLVAGQTYEAENPGRNFQTDLAAALQEDANARNQRQQQLSDALGIINTVVPVAASSDDSGTEDTPPTQTQETDVLNGINRLVNAFNAVSAKVTPDNPVDSVTPVLNLNGTGTNATHFLGINHTTFSLSKRWNKIAADPTYAITHSIDDEPETYSESFRNEVRSFGKGVMNRFAFLLKHNMLDTVRKNAFTNDYSGLSDAGLGDRYIIRRQDAIIARLMKHADIYQHFPRQFNVQDSVVMLSAFFTEVSQAWQRGEVWKGSMDLQPELGFVDDAMIKINFPPMEEIERLYIGYTNKEYSDPMKYTMYEYQYVNIMETAVSEQFHRKIMGIFVAPEKGVPGSYLTSSTGLVYTLIRYYHENKLLPFIQDYTFIGYDANTILDTVSSYCMAVKEIVDEDDTIKFEDLAVTLNKKDQIIWKKAVRKALGDDTDFTGTDSYLYRVPDIDTRIIWLDNLDKTQFMFMQEPGNVQFLENKPGEMFATKMFERFEEMLFSSRWKEGTSAEFVGRKFNTLEEMKANNFKYQRLFMNRPSTILADGATTLDAKKGFWFLSSDNTAATAVTDVTGAKKGVAYILEIDSATNLPTIAKAAKFSEISAAFNPVKKGDYLMFILNEAGDKYLELERRVNGVRTINVKLQPNIPGAR